MLNPLKKSDRVPYNFKAVLCKDFHTHVRGVPVFLKKIGSIEKHTRA